MLRKWRSEFFFDKKKKKKNDMGKAVGKTRETT